MNSYYWPFGLALLLFLGWACRPSAISTAESLTPAQAADWLKQNPQGQLIDVRSPEEYAPEHIKGARLIPVQELESRLPEIKKDKPILLYCHSGRRSTQALQMLKDHGFTNLFQVAGGIMAWKDQGQPVESSPK